MKHAIACLVVALAPTLGCDSGKSEDGKTAKAAAAPAESKAGKDAKATPKAKPAEEGLPKETESLALDEGESAIPATIEVPKGSTTFNDDPTTIRVEWGKMGKLFGVQIAKGNEYNTNLADLEKGMLENKYGNTNKILEKTDTLLRYSMQREGSDPNHKFQMLMKIGDDTWVCKDGNYGGWTAEASARQVEACKTFKGK